MAVELLRWQVEHLDDEQDARRTGKQGPPTLSIKREAHHDLEAFLWVLVYAMMIHHYNSLTHETDRTKYKGTIDNFFGHGSAEITTEKRQTLYLAHSRVGGNWVPKWFPDPHEERFFIRCMTLISKHDRVEEDEEDHGTFKDRISYENPLWDSSDDEGESSPDEDVENQSGTYRQGKATKGVQKSVANLRECPPVITYQSVIAIIKKSIDEL